MNDSLRVFLYILVMAAVTYLIRVTPLVLFRKKIRSRYLQSFFAYIPYAALSAMTIPAVFFSTGSVVTAAAGALTAVILTVCKRSFVTVALGACVGALLSGLIFNLL
ncbi:MAG: AzlD domain-containing protein [Clostridia bacterium]|nr:AzlD domain-containing protein [Clostridia bacterium]